jgi:hypothetical protein
VPVWLLEFSASDCKLERGQVLARQEGVEVGRREEQTTISGLHRLIVPA